MAVASTPKKELKNKIATLPDTCGVYMFKDQEGRIIYIGKAKSLKKRVSSYFIKGISYKQQVLVSHIADVDYILSSSEAQAQLLEAALIKQRQPFYNISLKDDKSFPRVRITNEEFPQVSIARRKGQTRQDRSLYFGPYTNVGLLRQAFKLMRRIFGFRSCRIIPKRACLYGRLKLCPAPCSNKIKASEYKETIKEIKMFLSGRNEELLHKLYAKMKAAAEQKRYEDAAGVRDQINALSTISQGKAYRPHPDELEDLRNLLGLGKLPRRIEAFDISNIYGCEATGSMVSFWRGFADKDNYRRFRIKSVEGVDDYRMLREVVRRRYARLKKENLPLPDLIIIDGGRQHLLSAEREIKELGLKISLASIAKEKENIYIQNRNRPLQLKINTPALNLIRRIRDEAHRFAISYHHVLRRKKIIGK